MSHKGVPSLWINLAKYIHRFGVKFSGFVFVLLHRHISLNIRMVLMEVDLVNLEVSVSTYDLAVGWNVSAEREKAYE